MLKNVASQVVGVQMITAADGTDFTSAITCEVTKDGGIKSGGGGTGPTHEGEGFWTYIPTQAETNADHIAFTFAASGAISTTVQVYTDASYDRIGAPAGASASADIAAVKAETALIVADTNELQSDDVPGLIAALDAVVDTVKAETALIVADTNELQTDDVPGLIAALDAVVDTVKAETALIVADTNELQSDDVPGLIAALDAVVDTVKAETALIVADTNELQTDDLPGLIAALDAVVDTVKAETVLILSDTNNILVDTGTTLPALIDDLAVKKNATFSNFEFLMVLTSDHVTPATGLTVTGQRSIDGAAFASVGGSIAEVSNGIYQFDALAADTNGDVITWRFSSATADDTFVTFKTVA